MIMSIRLKIWSAPVLFYISFFSWYTDFGGPLSDSEIDQYVATMNNNGRPAEVIAFMTAFAQQDTGRQFLMVNNDSLRPTRHRTSVSDGEQY